MRAAEWPLPVLPVHLLLAHELEHAARKEAVAEGTYRREFLEDSIEAGEAHVQADEELRAQKLEQFTLALRYQNEPEKLRQENPRDYHRAQANTDLATDASSIPTYDATRTRILQQRSLNQADPLRVTANHITGDTTIARLARQAQMYHARRIDEALDMLDVAAETTLRGTVFNLAWRDDRDVPENDEKSTMGGTGGVSPPPPPTPMVKMAALDAVPLGVRDRAPRWARNNPYRDVPIAEQEVGSFAPLMDTSLDHKLRLLYLARQNAPTTNAWLEHLWRTYEARDRQLLAAAMAAGGRYPPGLFSVSWDLSDGSDLRLFIDRAYKIPWGTNGVIMVAARHVKNFDWTSIYQAPNEPAPGPWMRRITETSFDPTLQYYPFTFHKRAAVGGSAASLLKYCYLMWSLIRALNAPPRHPRYAPPYPRLPTGAVDATVLKNEMDTIFRLCQGHFTYLDTRDADEEAFLLTMGDRVEGITPERFDELFFNADTALFDLDATYFQQDALYTGSVRPKMKTSLPFYYRIATRCRSFYFYNDRGVDGGPTPPMVNAGAIAAVALAVPLVNMLLVETFRLISPPTFVPFDAIFTLPMLAAGLAINTALVSFFPTAAALFLRLAGSILMKGYQHIRGRPVAPALPIQRPLPGPWPVVPRVPGSGWSALILAGAFGKVFASITPWIGFKLQPQPDHWNNTLVQQLIAAGPSPAITNAATEAANILLAGQRIAQQELVASERAIHAFRRAHPTAPRLADISPEPVLPSPGAFRQRAMESMAGGVRNLAQDIEAETKWGTPDGHPPWDTYFTAGLDRNTPAFLSRASRGEEFGRAGAGAALVAELRRDELRSTIMQQALAFVQLATPDWFQVAAPRLPESLRGIFAVDYVPDVRSLQRAHAIRAHVEGYLALFQPQVVVPRLDERAVRDMAWYFRVLGGPRLVAVLDAASSFSGSVELPGLGFDLSLLNMERIFNSSLTMRPLAFAQDAPLHRFVSVPRADPPQANVTSVADCLNLVGWMPERVQLRRLATAFTPIPGSREFLNIDLQVLTCALIIANGDEYRELRNATALEEPAALAIGNLVTPPWAVRWMTSDADTELRLRQSTTAAQRAHGEAIAREEANARATIDAESQRLRDIMASRTYQRTSFFLEGGDWERGGFLGIGRLTGIKALWDFASAAPGFTVSFTPAEAKIRDDLGMSDRQFREFRFVSQVLGAMSYAGGTGHAAYLSYQYWIGGIGTPLLDMVHEWHNQGYSFGIAGSVTRALSEWVRDADRRLYHRVVSLDIISGLVTDGLDAGRAAGFWYQWSTPWKLSWIAAATSTIQWLARLARAMQRTTAAEPDDLLTLELRVMALEGRPTMVAESDRLHALRDSVFRSLKLWSAFRSVGAVLYHLPGMARTLVTPFFQAVSNRLIEALFVAQPLAPIPGLTDDPIGWLTRWVGYIVDHWILPQFREDTALTWSIFFTGLKVAAFGGIHLLGYLLLSIPANAVLSAMRWFLRGTAAATAGIAGAAAVAIVDRGVLGLLERMLQSLINAISNNMWGTFWGMFPFTLGPALKDTFTTIFATLAETRDRSVHQVQAPGAPPAPPVAPLVTEQIYDMLTRDQRATLYAYQRAHADRLDWVTDVNTGLAYVPGPARQLNDRAALAPIANAPLPQPRGFQALFTMGGDVGARRARRLPPAVGVDAGRSLRLLVGEPDMVVLSTGADDDDEVAHPYNLSDTSSLLLGDWDALLAIPSETGDLDHTALVS